MAERSEFKVDNAGNTCYIDSLLMGLFMPQSITERLLKKDPAEKTAIYLQEYIKINFVERVRRGERVDIETMEMIRILCVHNGWLKEKNRRIGDIETYDQQDVNEYYHFMMELLGGELIEIQRETITECALPDKSDIGEARKLPFIQLSIPLEKKKVTVKEILYEWMYDNCLDIKRYVITGTGKEEKMVKGLNVNRIVNTPDIIGLSINRFTNPSRKRIETEVIIQEKIYPFKNVTVGGQDVNQPLGAMMMQDIKWKIQSIICHKGETTANGHYYTVLRKEGKWYRFDDLYEPSMWEVSLSDERVKGEIKKDCVFLIYVRM